MKLSEVVSDRSDIFLSFYDSENASSFSHLIKRILGSKHIAQRTRAHALRAKDLHSITGTVCSLNTSTYA